MIHGVMPGLVPGIHVLVEILALKDVDGRDKPGHDELGQVVKLNLPWVYRPTQRGARFSMKARGPSL
jgi:hypothetical protein